MEKLHIKSLSVLLIAFLSTLVFFFVGFASPELKILYDFNYIPSFLLSVNLLAALVCSSVVFALLFVNSKLMPEDGLKVGLISGFLSILGGLLVLFLGGSFADLSYFGKKASEALLPFAAFSLFMLMGFAYMGHFSAKNYEEKKYWKIARASFGTIGTAMLIVSVGAGFAYYFSMGSADDFWNSMLSSSFDMVYSSGMGTSLPEPMIDAIANNMYQSMYQQQVSESMLENILFSVAPDFKNLPESQRKQMLDNVKGSMSGYMSSLSKEDVKKMIKDQTQSMMNSNELKETMKAASSSMLMQSDMFKTLKKFTPLYVLLLMTTIGWMVGFIIVGPLCMLFSILLNNFFGGEPGQSSGDQQAYKMEQHAMQQMRKEITNKVEEFKVIKM